MDSPEALDVSKENIQPLRQGRVASQLSAALQAQTDATILQNLLKKRQEYELLLRTYDGDDPLSIWFEYVEWVEQSFPKDGKEGNLMTLLQNCLTRFKDSVEYFQDIRLVKLWIKYLEKLENPLELYTQLHCHGIGSQCALFYKCWAYELYENDDFRQANKVLLTGIGRNAQPIEELKRAHENFQIAVARRVMDNSLPVSEENKVGEERKVGNILTTFGKKHKVPSVRIGGRVKSNFPGTLHSKENLMPQRNVDHVNIYEAENDPEMARSVNKMQTVPHFETLKKENTKKPTPWSGVKQKTAHQFQPPKPSFQVLTEENSQPEPLNTVMFLNALKPKKDDGFNCPIAIFEVPNPNQQAMYPKDQVYAGGTEYSLEELKAVKYLKPKEKRNKALSDPDTQDATGKETTVCTTSDSAETEKLNPLTACVSGTSIFPSKKESNLSNCTENNMLLHKQELNASSNNYEKCMQRNTSSTTGSDCFLGDKKLSEDPSVPNSQCVEGPKYTDSASNHLAEMENLCSSVSCRVFTPVAQSIVNGISVPKNVHNFDTHCSENTDIISSSTKQNSCTQALLLATNDQQKLNSQGTFQGKGSGCTILTTGNGINFPGTVKAGVPFTSLNKDDMPCSENADTVSSPKQKSCTSALLAQSEQQKLHNQEDVFRVKESNFSVLTVEDRTCSPETVKADDGFTPMNKEEIPYSETSNILASNKPSSCMPTLLGAENNQQKQINHGKSSLKNRGFSVFTAEDGIDTPEIVKAGDFFTSLNKEDIPYSENAGHSSKASTLVAENKQQVLHNQETFSVKGSDSSVFTTAGGTDAPEAVKTCDIITYSRTEEKLSRSDHSNNLLLSNKVEHLNNPVLMQGNENKQYEEIHEGNISVNKNCFPEFPIFSDEENCYAKAQGGLVKAGKENESSGFPSKNKNIFSHSVLCGPNKPLHDDVRFTSSTTKKNKVAPFPLFIDDGEVPVDRESCATKRELFREVTCEPSDNLCHVDSKENFVIPSMYTPVSRPITEKKEIKVCDNVVTASMIKLRQKKAPEQIKEPAAEEFEQVVPATVVPKKSEGCVPSSISASSEEMLKMINQCWATPPKSKRDPGNLCPEPQKEPEERDFQPCLPLKLSALFPENKENALPLCTKQNVLEPSNTSENDDWLTGQFGEPRALDDTCCTLMFSKTLVSSTPNRKSGGPLSSDSSETSPPDSQEFKIPGRCTPSQAERFPIMPRHDVLSVIMESSKENKSQSSSGSSSGGRTTHHTAFSLVSPQTGNTHSALETQPQCEANAVMTRPIPPLDDGDSSI